MGRVGIVSSVIGLVALGLGTGSVAYAQKPASTPSSSITTGAFDKLSIGNQKVASALFQAQNGTTSTPLTLDEIAAKKQGGQGWGDVFKGMQAQGLVQEKNLGQVVSKYNHSTNEVVTTASGRVVSGHSGNATNAKGVSEGSSSSPGNSGNAGGAGHGKGNAFGASSGKGGK